MGWQRSRRDDVEDVVCALREIKEEIHGIAKLLARDSSKSSFQFTVGPVSPKGECSMALTVQSTNEEKVLIKAVPVTSTGRPATVDGPVRVEVISGDSTITMVDDKSFYLVSADNPGDTSVLVEADADLGQGVVLVQDTVTYTVAGAHAVNLGLVANAPEPK